MQIENCCCSVCFQAMSRPDAPEQPVVSELHASYQPPPDDGGTTVTCCRPIFIPLIIKMLYAKNES